jgi:transcriptional regulator with XRE-family HTH domain
MEDRLNSTRPDGLMAARRHAGYTQGQLAANLDIGVSTLSSWERGVRPPSPRHRRPLAELLGISLDRLYHLIGLEVPAELQGDLSGHRVPHWLSLYDSLVQEAGRLDQVEKALVPALLQTRAYAATVERYGPRKLTEEQLRQRVEGRLARQRVLRRRPEPLQLVALVAESAFHEMVGGREVMFEQYSHLLAVVRESNVELRVIPAEGQAGVAPGSFQLIVRPGETEPFVACIFDVGGPHYDEDEARLANFVAHYEYLYSVGLPTPESIRRIETMREDLRS